MSLDGVPYDTWVLPGHLQAVAMSASFEEAIDALEMLPRLHAEPDGSFVFVSPGESPSRWQLDGVLHDLAHRLVGVELKGTCPLEQLEQLLPIFHPPEAILFELVSSAVFLDRGQFLQWLAIQQTRV